MRRHLAVRAVLATIAVACLAGETPAQTRRGTKPARRADPVKPTDPGKRLTADELQAAQRIYDLLLEVARVQASKLSAGSQQKAAGQVTSPRWTTEYEVEPVKRTVTPVNRKPVPMAVRPPVLLAYLKAVEAEQADKVRDHLDSREVVLVEEPLVVHVETRVRGLAYVRPAKGPHKGKFFVVDERYVK